MASSPGASARVGPAGWLTVVALLGISLLAGWQVATEWVAEALGSLGESIEEWMPAADVPAPIPPLRVWPIGEPTLPVWIVDTAGVVAMLAVAVTWLRAAGRRHPFPGRGRAFWRTLCVTAVAVVVGDAARSVGMSLIARAGWDAAMTTLLGTVLVAAAVGLVLGLVIGGLAALVTRPRPEPKRTPRRASRQPDPFRELGLR